MKLTVLGKYGPYPPAGGACSGYLLQTDNHNILLDCGCGILSRLQRFCSLEKLDMIVLSHLHSDHMGDMLILRYALQILRKLNIRTSPLRVLAPKTPEAEFGLLAKEDVFDITPIENNMQYKIGRTEFLFSATSHSVECYAMRIVHDGHVLCYSGDTNVKGNLDQIAQRADVFLCDANFPNEMAGSGIPHLTAGEAGEIASRVQAKKLILTHLNPISDEQVFLVQAGAMHSNVMLAKEMETVII
ncbi:MAG: MBL fold metallo-hydrolase [Christensenellales bacterium]